MKFIQSLKIFYRFAFGIECDSEGCTYVHEHVSTGCQRHADRERRKASPHSDEPATLKQAKTEIAATRATCYRDWS